MGVAVAEEDVVGLLQRGGEVVAHRCGVTVSQEDRL